MNRIRVLFLILCTSVAFGQAIKDPQAFALVQQAAVVTGVQSQHDISIQANATWIVGRPRTGNAILRLKGIDESRADMRFGRNSTVELRNNVSSPQYAGEWIGNDGKKHASSLHNCWTPPGWFSPAAILAWMIDGRTDVSYIGLETWNKLPVYHLRASLHASDGLTRQLSRVDVYIDIASHLLWAVDFSTHPDTDAATIFAVEIRFANYQNVSGVAVPYRIQKLTRTLLELDMTVTSALVNSGLSDNTFALQ